MPDTAATIRDAARILLLDDEDRLLLFRIDDMPRPGITLWLTPGGGVQPGESFEEAALRELWEETGLRDVPLGPCVWRREWRGQGPGGLLEQRERYFLVRCACFEPVRDHFEAHEHEMMAAHRWWRLEEIVASRDYFIPRHLGRLLAPLMAGEIPPEPIDCGV